MAAAGLTIALLAGLPSSAPRPAARSATGAGATAARTAAEYFLRHYEIANGRVVRWDEKGDTVSEGEAYAMLLSVATGDRARFTAAWSWSERHLLQSSGLLAWHWQNGHILDPQPASDADLDAAYALELAGQRFHNPADSQAAAGLAAAIVAHESAAVAGGLILTGGPWATAPTVYVDPSYGSPEELISVSQLGSDSAALNTMAATSRILLTNLLGGGQLPPDWVRVSATGGVQPAPAPGTSGSPLYGFDAVRVPIRLADSCDKGDRQLAAQLWPELRNATKRGRLNINLALDGHSTDSSSVDPLGLIAAAGAAWADGRHSTATRLLSQAQSLNQRKTTYYSSAWVALAREFLQTDNLGGCAG